MHKREIDARLGEMEGREEKKYKPAVYRAMELVQKKKKRMQNGMSRDFESAPAANDRDSYKQPLLASLEVMIGSMRHLLWRLHSSTHTANPRHGTLGPEGRTTK
jgi:hypothetical protein